MTTAYRLCLAALLLAGCPRTDDVASPGTTGTSAKAASVSDVPPPLPMVQPAALNFRTAFRRVQLDPTVIGTTVLCDVSAIDLGGPTQPAWLACSNQEHQRHQSARVSVAATPALLRTITVRTQVRLRIEGPPQSPDDLAIDARASLVEVIGQLPAVEPSPRSGDIQRPTVAAPTIQAFSFGAYVRERHKYYGTKQTCDIAHVGEIGRSSATSTNPKARIFDEKKLPYFARVFCRAEFDAAEIVIGSNSLEMIAGLDGDLIIEVELGTATTDTSYPAGRLVRFLSP